MSYGPHAVFTASMASGGTLTTIANLTRGWANIFLEVPTLTSNTQIHVQGAFTTTDTFRRVKSVVVQTNSIQTNTFAIASGATNALIPLPAGMICYKVETTATVDDGATFRIICSD
jgi:hypothetical protein